MKDKSLHVDLTGLTEIVKKAEQYDSLAQPFKDGVIHCSFCGKRHIDVKRLIKGAGNVFICNECVELSSQILTEEEIKDSEETDK